MTINREKESIEAATFRRLVYHLQSNTDLQNIDLMNLAGFCRNCLSKWMVEEAKKKMLPLIMKVFEQRFMEWNTLSGKRNFKHQ